MIDVGIGMSLEKNAALAAEEALRMARRNKREGAKADLVLLISSPDFYPPSLLKVISNLLEGIPLLGACSPLFVTEQGMFLHGILVCLISFPEGSAYATAFTKDIRSKDTQACGAELGEKLIAGFKQSQRNLGLLLFDTPSLDSQAFMNGFQEHLGRSFPCFGAAVSESGQAPSLYFNQHSFNDAVTGLMLGGKISFGMGMKHGWKPLGKPHTITASSGNVIVSIDDRPAVDLYEDYLGYSPDRLSSEIRSFSPVYPIGMVVPEEEEYLLRTAIRVREDGALVCIGDIIAGSTVRLMISTRETCLSAARQAGEEAAAALSAGGPAPHKDGVSSFAVAFSSFSRYTLLRRDAVKEMDSIRQALKHQGPFIGAYTYGELAPLKASSYRGRVYFHNQTVSALLFRG